MQVETPSLAMSIHRHHRLLGIIVGMTAILLALTSFATDLRLSDLFVWLQNVFGWGYALVYVVLLGTGVYCWRQLSIAVLKKSPAQIDRNTQVNASKYWLELGQQAAGGIATLSLTFTLLGISLGIGALSDKTIDPQSVQGIIQELTGHFSTAFMTTVVGLPTANILRAAIALRHVRIQINLEGSSQ